MHSKSLLIPQPYEHSFKIPFILSQNKADANTFAVTSDKITPLLTNVFQVVD